MEKLKNLVRRDNPRIAIVGIGAELNGDDAIGLLTARKLKPIFSQRDDTLVLEGGALPESMSAPLRRFSPELVIFLDAADTANPPGTISIIEPQSIGGASFSTHAMPLSLLLQYLRDEINCETIIIGVQPELVEFGTAVSESGKKAIDLLAKELTGQLKLVSRGG